jgi:hypothetical protein
MEPPRPGASYMVVNYEVNGREISMYWMISRPSPDVEERLRRDLLFQSRLWQPRIQRSE